MQRVRHQITVTVTNRLAEPSPLRIQILPLKQAAQKALDYEGVNFPVELSILLCDDFTIRELNRLYRDCNCPTDVLSFPQDTDVLSFKASTPHPQPSRLPVHPFTYSPILLGDVVISVETAARQAKRYKHTLEEELARLIVHGTLHLVGFDDRNPSDRRKMHKREREIVRIWRKEGTKSRQSRTRPLKKLLP